MKSFSQYSLNYILNYSIVINDVCSILSLKKTTPHNPQQKWSCINKTKINDLTKNIHEILNKIQHNYDFLKAIHTNSISGFYLLNSICSKSAL